MKLLLVGATGLVGRHVLGLALADARIDAVISPTRHPLPDNPKLFAPIVNFERLPEDAHWWRAGAWCTDRLVGVEELGGVGERPFLPLEPIVPFKLNQDRRHHIPRQQRKVTNWPAYDARLRQRGSLTLWFTDEAIAAWKAEPRTTRGGQPWYSELAILTALTLRAVFRLAYRQTEGLIGSLIHLLGLDLPVPDHTTLSRRAATLEVPRPRPGSSADGDSRAEPVHLLVDSTGLKLCGPGEWLVEKHGAKTRRSWRK